MISEDHLQILISVLQDNCTDGKVVDRGKLFYKFESIAKSGIEIFRFKKALSFFIHNGTISGYEIKAGRNGGVYKNIPMERVSITCTSGKFIGEVSKQELSQLLSNLKQTKKR
jgi:cobyric acid synthase